MSVLVTGGAGYIGSHTVRALREAGTDVVVLDSLEFGHAEAVLDAPLVVGDIADVDLVGRTRRRARRRRGRALRRATRPRASRWRCPSGTSTTTWRGPRDCSRRSTSRGVDRIVFSSSCSVYGTPSTLPVDESHPTGPESPYAESKLLVERMLHWYDACHGVRSVSLRYFNAAGASADARARRGLPQAAEPRPARDARRARQDPEARGVRHRLPHRRRHVRPRLHPRRRPRRRARARARAPRRRRRHARAQRRAPVRDPRCSRSSTARSG